MAEDYQGGNLTERLAVLSPVEKHTHAGDPRIDWQRYFAAKSDEPEPYFGLLSGFQRMWKFVTTKVRR